VLIEKVLPRQADVITTAELPGLLAGPLAVAWVPRDEPLARRPLREIITRVDVCGIVLFGGMMSSLLVFLLSVRTSPTPACTCWPWCWPASASSCWP
jgi:hypothetical protein